MADSKSRRRKSKGAPGTRKSRPTPPEPSEPRLVDAATVAWTVTVSTVVLSELGAVLAHGLALANPGLPKVAVLRDLLLVSAAVIGSISLVLLPVVYRVRATKPPLGFTVFAACAAAAPILALVARALQAA